MKKYSFVHRCLVVGIMLLFLGTTVIPLRGQQIEKISSPMSRGNTLYVGGSGPGNYTAIQDAIDNASDGDTIIVYNGTYNSIIIDKELTLIGINSTGGNQPCIYGNGHVPVTIQASGCTFHNFCWDNNYEGCGVIINSNNNTISQCDLGHVGTGILINSENGNRIVNNKLNLDGSAVTGQGNQTLFYHNDFTNQAEHSIDFAGYDNRYIENSVDDFYLGDCFNSSFVGNTLESFQLFRSKNDTIINNTFTGNGLSLYGTLDQLNSYTISGNTLHGKPIYYYANKQHLIVSGDASQVILVNCSHCVLLGLNALASGSVSLLYCTNNTIRDNIIQTASYGIYLYQSSDNTITNNTILGGVGGVYIDYGMNNTISSNSLRGCNMGLEFNYPAYNNISFNTISSCGRGIDLDYANNTLAFKNTISRCHQYGIVLYSSWNSTLIKNKISGSYNGIYARWGSALNFSNNVIKFNVFGIFLESGSNVVVFNNRIITNICGLYCQGSHALVTKNNFILDGCSATFTGTNNKWAGNFWGVRHPLFPKAVLGALVGYIDYIFPVIIPWINIDWHPAHLPNHIGG